MGRAGYTDESRRDGRARERDSVHVLLIEPGRGPAAQIAEMLRSGWAGSVVLTHAESLADAQSALIGAAVEVILLGGEGYVPLLEQARVSVPAIPVIVVAPEYSAADAASALRAGAQDYVSMAELTPPSLARAIVHALERKRSEAGLAQRALQDPLTGLPNRNLFIDRVGVALDRARRSGGVTAVLFLDVDGFKAINDSLGHAVGDEVLSGLAARLRTALRPMDTVARFGGDEFTFVFEGLSSDAEAAAIAERVRAAASQPILLGGEERRLQVSIGVATTADPTIAPESLIREADFAMYASKRGHSGSAAPAPPLSPPPLSAPPLSAPPLSARPADARFEPAADRLRQALEGGELDVVYQPLYGIGNGGDLVGFEALARWEHPSRGTLVAADFVPLAEQNGLLAPIGRFVLHRALELLARLRDTRPSLTVSINLGPGQLSEGELADALEAIRASHVHPSSICVEIPERAVSEDPERARRATRVLRAAGIRVAVDDYGTGDVSLSNLRTLHADELKIHESFVRELDDAPRSEVVRALVELGHALGMMVVAEGVETEDQLGELRSLGCDVAQGYLLSRPLAAEQLEQLVLAGR